MMKKWLFCALGLVCLSCFCAAATVPRSRHVWIIGEENHSFEDASASMPFLMELGRQYGIADQYYADMHNSISALMHLTAGQTVTTDDSTPDTFNVDNIVRHLARARLTFRSYQEHLPSPGFLGLSSGPYVKRHNPLAYFTDVADTGLRFNLVPLPQLAADLANHATANFNYITPDLNHDAHDGSLQTADEWLRQYVPAILAQPEFQPGGDGLLFVFFDEGNLGGNIDFRCNATHSDPSCGGHVLTVVAGPNVKRGFHSEVFYDHENLLATVCRALGTDGCPGKSANAKAMDDFFIAPLSASPGTAAVSSGEPAQFSLAVQPVGGFYDSDVTLSCGQLPAGADCAFSPATVHLGGGGVTATLTVTLAPSARLHSLFGRRLGADFALWMGLPGLMLLPGALKRRNLLLALAALVLLLLCLGCGGGSIVNAKAGNSANAYDLTVTARSASATYSVPLRLRLLN